MVESLTFQHQVITDRIFPIQEGHLMRVGMTCVLADFDTALSEKQERRGFESTPFTVLTEYQTISLRLIKPKPVRTLPSSKTVEPPSGTFLLTTVEPTQVLPPGYPLAMPM